MEKNDQKTETVSVKFPQNGTTLTPEDVKKDADSKFKDMNLIVMTVVIILLVMVATLIIDSFHINSATYKEYSQKTDSIETMQKTNEELLKTIQELSEQAKEDREVIKQLLRK
jgi:cell division protein FtsB